MLRKIVSGAQTGVDRSALDVALELGIDCGGWCPADRKAEDGDIPCHYPVEPLPSGGYDTRTKCNVRDSDGTLILAVDELTGGTLLTYRYANTIGKPCCVVDPTAMQETASVSDWMGKHGIKVLNIAGPRESGSPGIYVAARAFLTVLLSRYTQL